MAQRILVVHPHPLFIEAVTSCIDVLLPDAVVENAHDTLSATSLLREKEFSGIVIDLSMPEARGLNALIALRILSARIPIIVFADTVSGHLADSARACGAAAFVPKSATKGEVLDHLRSVLIEGIPVPRAKEVLSKTELRVSQLMSNGLLNKQIAYELGVQEQTVKAHVTQILRKLRVTFRTQVVVKLADVERVRWHGHTPCTQAMPLDSLSNVASRLDQQAAA